MLMVCSAHPTISYTSTLCLKYRCIFGKGKEKIPAMPGSPKHEILNSKQIQITEIRNSKRDCFVPLLLRQSETKRRGFLAMTISYCVVRYAYNVAVPATAKQKLWVKRGAKYNGIRPVPIWYGASRKLGIMARDGFRASCRRGWRSL